MTGLIAGNQKFISINDDLKFILDLLRDTARAKPELLPEIWVHADIVWLAPDGTAPSLADIKGNLHMCETDFRIMKNQGAPFKLLREVKSASVTIFKFDYKIAKSLDVNPVVEKKKQSDFAMGHWGSDVVEDKKAAAKPGGIDKNITKRVNKKLH